MSHYMCVLVHRYVRGWFSPYHRQRKIINPLFAEQIQNQAKMYASLDTLSSQILTEHSELLYSNTVKPKGKTVTTHMPCLSQSLIYDMSLSQECAPLLNAPLPQVRGGCRVQGTGGEAGDGPTLPRINGGRMDCTACHSSAETTAGLTEGHPSCTRGHGTVHQ